MHRLLGAFSRPSLQIILIFVLGLVLAACPVGPPNPGGDDDDVVAPPDDDDDDGVACEGDYDCEFASGLEICSDSGQCIEGDRNNGIAEAQLMEMNSSVSLPLAPADDVDWFSFYGNPGDLVLLSSNADDTDLLDTFLVFADAAGNIIAYNDDFDRVSSIAPDSRLYTGVSTQGLWYFAVQDRRTWVNDPSDPPGGGPDHGYTVTLTSAEPDNYVTISTDDDDGWDGAVVWAVTDPYTNYTAGGMLEPALDEDWFSVAVEPGEVLRLYGFPNGGSLGSIEVAVYLSDGVTLVDRWVDLTWETANRARVPVLEDGPYYLRVSEAAGLGGFDYWYYLHAAKNPAKEGAPPETEPNNSEAEAQALGVGEHSFWARLFPSDDSDVYSLEAEAGDLTTVTLARVGDDDPTAVQIELTDASGASVGSASWAGEEDPVFTATSLAAGTHHLTITPQDASAISSANHYYQLDVIFTRP